MKHFLLREVESTRVLDTLDKICESDFSILLRVHPIDSGLHHLLLLLDLDGQEQAEHYAHLVQRDQTI